MTVPPKVVAELGPGRSVASGLAALLSGADTYICYEVEPHFDLDGALAELKELVELFRQRADLVAPSTSDVRPRLDSYHFPLEAVGGLHRLEQGLQPERVRAIRDALRRSAKGTAPTSAPVRIEYVTSWDRLAATLNHHPVDMVFSQAVMQYVEDVGQAYRHCFRWLRSGGWMSHQIDFSAHETACVWSGHWSYSDLVWRIIRGRKPFFLNRKPLSSHVDFARSAGFDLVAAVLTMDTNGIGRDELAPRFRHLTDQDLKTRSGFLLCRKP
jgi:SAM-dependent methyltransferase